jgi:hypothetical protein
MRAIRKKFATKRSAPKRARKPPRAHLLIIECDSRELASQGMHLGTGFSQIVRPLFPKKHIAIVRTSTEAKLQEDLAHVFREFGRFRTILIVGHSNPQELMLTSEGCRSWAAVGQWIKIFEPEFLFLAACEAGQSEAVRAVFDTVASLRQIYASPVSLYKIHTAPLGVLIFMLLWNGNIDPEQSQALRLVHYVLSGGQLYRWRRSEAGPGQELTGKLWDAVGTNLDFGPWDLLKKLEGLFPIPTKH